MRTGRALGLVCAVALVTCAAVHGEDELAADLKFYGVKIERGADGKVSKVTLPPGARDYHLELVLDNPAVAASVTELHAPRCKGSFPRIKELANLPSLAALDFEGAVHANDYVACVQGMGSRLKRLSLAGSSLTNHGLSDICNSHPNLRKLDISGTKVTIEFAIPMLVELRQLESLQLLRLQRDLLGYQVSSEPVLFGRLADLPRLTSLSASGFEITTEQLLPFACNCHLDKLFLDGLRTDVDALIYLHECHPQLPLGPRIASGLGISFTGTEWVTSIHNCPYPRFRRMPRRLLSHLEELEVIAAKDLAFLEWTPALKHLQLNGLHLQGDELFRLAKSPNIELLTISHAKIDTKIVDLLLSTSTLKQFSFESCEIDAKANETIRQHSGNGRIRVDRD